MRTLIFDYEHTGHHLEFMHHYYLGAIDRPNEEFIFCTVDAFTNQYSITQHPNITISIITNEELESVHHKQGMALKIQVSKLIRKKIKQFNADKVIMTNFRNLLPVLPFYIPSTVRLRGIIYSLFFYCQTSSYRRILGDIIYYMILANCRVIEKVFILNDKESTAKLNKMFRTDKFYYLPDPVPEVDFDRLKNIRRDLNIPESNKVFLHFGHMERRKGTLEILDAIEISSSDSLKSFTFVFAGRISDNIKQVFYKKINYLKDKAHIIVYDDFCSFDFIFDLCYSSDILLAPYTATDCSSGVIGYGAVFNKPVVAPSSGLIGKLMKENNLGYYIESTDSISLQEAFMGNITCKSNKYVSSHGISDFNNIIFNTSGL